MAVKLDEIDRSILRILQKDSKTVAKSIADELGLTKTPVYERIKRLEQVILKSLNVLWWVVNLIFF